MKKLYLIIFLALLGYTCSAQYNYNYHPDDYASAFEARKLNNVRFNPEAFADNPAICNRYTEYLNYNAECSKKRESWANVEVVGGVIACIGLVPMFESLNKEGDTGSALTAIGAGISFTGLITVLVGWAGYSEANNKMKNNKKEMIYYLKTNNNGVGIVTLF